MFGKPSAKIEAIKSVPMFSELDKKHLELISKQFDEVTLSAGNLLAEEGKIGQEFIILLEGQARVEREGKQINTLFTGSFFGEIALLDRGPRTASVIAETDVDLLVLSAQYFDDLLDEIPELSRALLRSLSLYIRNLQAPK